jgi:hypothetical protein
MFIHYPSLPAPDPAIELRHGVELRDIIKTCADNDVPFRFAYKHSGRFRYYSDQCRSSR